MDPKVSKLSFAKVAASSYVPLAANVEKGATRQTPSTPQAPHALQLDMDNSSQDRLKEPQDEKGQSCAESGKPDIKSNGTLPSQAEEGGVKITSNDDGSTQLSSDDSAKPLSFDCKSVASGATFGLDEKESLRPDDSASVRAVTVEDDEFLSAPGSVVAGSRVGSDVGASAFREQLREIAFMNSMPRGNGSHAYQGPVIVSTVAIAQPSAIKPLISPESQAMLPLNGVPDEKLIEALQSQRDRVWVLKLEQDIIDFIGQSKETTLTLPQCNAFYRMLAHKLADYYKLEHSVDHTATGAAVVITRTAQSRIPPPLSGVPNPATISNTPPLIIPARKIMRRPDDPKTSETSTAANSEGPSAATSEVGAESSNEPSDLKKSQLTREEREAKYAEARERIFGKQDETESNENSGGENISRASSTTGRKKVNKQRNLSNDDFEPRSQFPPYYGQPYPNNVQGDQFYYQQYSGAPQQYPPPAINQNYSPGYQMMPNESSFAWNTSMNAQAPLPGPYPQGPAGYDMSAHFHAGMQSFQSAPSAGGKMPPPAISPYGPSQVPHWHQTYDQSYQYGRPQYSPPDRQVMMQAPPYPYGQYPYPYPGSAPPKPQPTGYTRPQFNPQIHPFIPSANNRIPMPHSMPPSMSPYQYQPPNPMPNVSRSAPPGPTNRPGFSSPHTMSASTPVSSVSPAQDVPTATGASTSPPNAMTTPNSVPAGPAATAVAKVPEITAKWGTPSHLPPKPPPPKSMEPHKYIEINRGLHPYPGLPLPRIGVGANGFGGGAVAAAHTGAAGGGAGGNRVAGTTSQAQ